MTRRTDFFLLGGGAVIAVVINAVTWYMLYYQIPKGGDWIVLQYDIYRGITLTGEWYRVFYIAASGLIVIVINTVLAWLFYKSIKVLSYFLVYSSVVLQGILLLASIFIIYNNRI